MKHTDYKELLHLQAFDELNADERAILDQHLQTCPECRTEIEELRSFGALLDRNRGFEITDQLLDEARRELRVALRLEQSRKSAWSGLMDRMDALFSPGARFAFGGAVMLVVGLLGGYLIFAPSEPKGMSGLVQSAGQTPSEVASPRVSNFKFASRPTDGNDVEFTFDMVTPVHMKGSINDAPIQRILAQALVNDENPGARLRSVSALAEQSDALKSSDTEIRSALIKAVTSDPNVGVRKQALQALHKFPIDAEVRDVLLFVLKNEGNPAMRIEAIAYLQSPELSRKLVDKDLLEVLKEKMKSDDNTYVRTRAKHFYEEVNQQ